MNITKLEIHSRINKFALLTFAFLIPFQDYLTSYPFIILSLNWLIEGRFKEKINAIIKNRFILLFISFYLVYLFGLIYSSNLDYAFNDLRIKLPLFFFPIFLSNISFNKELINKIFSTFIFACFVAIILCLISAAYYFFYEGLNNFSYIKLSIFKHPGYFSLYINLCVIILFSKIIKKKERFFLSDYLHLILIFFLGLFILMLSSKMAIIILAIELITYITILFMKKRWLISFGTLSIIVLAIVLSNHYFPSAKGRFVALNHDAIKASSVANNNITQEKNSNSKKNKYKSSTFLRINILKISLQLISENPILGVGTGDIRQVLTEKYNSIEGMDIAYEKKLNPHNQYLQTTIALGFLGLSILLAMFIIPFYNAYKNKHHIYLMFLLLFGLNLLTDSLLEVQAGVMFYGFFNAVLFFSNTNLTDNNG